MKKFSMFLTIAVLTFVMNACFGWELPAGPFGSKFASSNGLRASQLIAGEIGIYSMPTASLGFGVGPTNAPSYGYSGGYDFVLGKAVGTDSNTVNFSPYLGAGLAVYVDLADFIKTSGIEPIKADGGINIIGPEIQGLVPSASRVWNFDTGEQVTTINLTASLDFFANATIQKVVAFN